MKLGSKQGCVPKFMLLPKMNFVIQLGWKDKQLFQSPICFSFRKENLNAQSEFKHYFLYFNIGGMH